MRIQNAKKPVERFYRVPDEFGTGTGLDLDLFSRSQISPVTQSQISPDRAVPYEFRLKFRFKISPVQCKRGLYVPAY
jgi:hypothetical protein